MTKKQVKIWGTSYGLIGDLIMGLPLLTYFEKKYPGSYKHWVIQKKCSICAPLYFNHPLIDRIKITDEWSGFGKNDRELMNNCLIKCVDTAKHNKYDWYNEVSCVEETARLAGFHDIKEVLSEDEMRPRLYKWFDVGFSNSKVDTYSRQNNIDLGQFKNNVAIWPFATGGHPGRSPSSDWWKRLINILTKENITVYHYGRDTEPVLSNSKKYIKFTAMSFFEQIKASLASSLAVGPDTGPMWVMGAYSHPSVNLITNHMKSHDRNLLALAPVNDNAFNAFTYYNYGIGCDAMKVERVAEIINEKIFNKEKK